MLIRVLIAGVLGVGVTFGLLLMMQQLIATGNKELDKSETLHFLDFVRVERSEVAETKDRKPEKPPKPEEPPPPAEEPQRKMEADVSGGEGLNMAAAGVDVNLDVGSGLGLTVADGDYLPIVKVAPIYPRRAQSRGIEGFVVLEFTVTKSGSVSNPRVVEADPEGIFNNAAIEAAKKFKYKPRVVDGEPIDVPGVLHRITFRLED